MTKGIDCAAPLTREKAQILAAAGIQFVCRYLVPDRYKWKRLTRTEAEAISAAGMNIVSVFETSANRAAGGATAGAVDGAEAYKEAQLIGQPKGTAIYFAVDYDAQPKDYGAIEAYLRAAAAKIQGYEVGVYASYSVIEEMARRGACERFWQTYAWSRGKRSEKANIYQFQNGQTLAAHTVDLNYSFGNEGWWSTLGTIEKQPKEHWAKKDHDELRAAGFLLNDHPDLDAPASKGMVIELFNRLRKTVAGSQPTPQPQEPPVPEPPKPPQTPPKQTKSWEEVEKLAAESSVIVESLYDGTHGSGALLKNGYVLTAKHVVSGEKQQKIKTKTRGALMADVIAEHPDADIALCKITDDVAIAKLPYLQISAEGVSAGLDLLTVGHPGHQTWVTSKGEVHRLTTNNDWEFDCSIEGEKNMSGSCIVNQYAEVVGVLIQGTTVNVQIGSVKKAVPGIEAINLQHPVIADWLKQYL